MNSTQSELIYLKKVWHRTRRLVRKVLASTLILFSRKTTNQQKENKKVRAIIASIIIVAFVAIIKLKLLSDVTALWYFFISALILAFIIYILTLWVLYFVVKRSTMLSVVFLPSVYGFMMTWFMFYIFNEPIVRVSTFIGFSLLLLLLFFSMYIIFLTTNILNANMFFYIPLSKLGESFLIVFEIVMIFLWSYLTRIYFETFKFKDLNTINMRIFILILGITWILILFFIVGIVFYYFIKNLKQAFIVSFTMITLILLILSILFVSIVNAIVIAGSLAFLVYTILIVLMHKHNRTLDLEVWVEVTALLAILGSGLVIVF